MAKPFRMTDEVSLIALDMQSDPDMDWIVESPARNISAEPMSVRQSEFYEALANALRPEIMFLVWAAEYQGEPLLEFRGVRYKIDRTYVTKDRRYVELTCSALDRIKTNLARLRDTIEIWHNASTENSMGEVSPLPERLISAPALVEYKGGGAAESDGIIETTNTLTITIRYREGITSDMWVMLEGNRYDIQFIEDPFDRHETLVLHVERVTP